MEHQFQPAHYHNTLGPHEPVLRLADGDSLRTTTVDARGFDAQRQQAATRGNPQRYDLGNVFDPAYTMVCKLPKELLPKRS